MFFIVFWLGQGPIYHIGGAIVGLLDSSVVDHGYEPTKHVALRCKRKDRLAQNHDVSTLNDVSTHRLVSVSQHYQIQISVLLYYKAVIIIISSKCSLFSPWCSLGIFYKLQSFTKSSCNTAQFSRLPTINC